MNILIQTAEGQIYTRPDTSWERKGGDYFVPEFPDGFSWSPVLFAHISRPGKSILPRFAGRYYDGVGFGLLLYAEPISGAAGLASSACLDHSSFLPETLFGTGSLQGNVFEVEMDGAPIFKTGMFNTEMVDEAMAAATRSCLVRRGDLLCMELAPIAHLCSREEGTRRIRAAFAGSAVLDFKLIYS